MKKRYEQLECDADKSFMAHTNTPESAMYNATRVRGGCDPRNLSVHQWQKERSAMVNYLNICLDIVENRQNGDQKTSLD